LGRYREEEEEEEYSDLRTAIKNCNERRRTSQKKTISKRPLTKRIFILRRKKEKRKKSQNHSFAITSAPSITIHAYKERDKEHHALAFSLTHLYFIQPWPP
jgi:hypothetical protein